MTKPLLTNSNVDAIRFNHVSKSERKYVKLSPSMFRELSDFSEKLERMYDSYTRGNHDVDNEKLRQDAIKYMLEHVLIYRASNSAYVINPWLSTSSKPLVYRVLKRTINVAGQLQ